MQTEHYRKDEFDSSFDEWLFLEIYMTDYSHSDEIAAIDDIDCYLNDGGVNHPDYASGPELETMPHAQIKALQSERNRLMRACLQDAFKNYIDKHYPA